MTQEEALQKQWLEKNKIMKVEDFKTGIKIPFTQG